MYYITLKYLKFFLLCSLLSDLIFTHMLLRIDLVISQLSEGQVCTYSMFNNIYCLYMSVCVCITAAHVVYKPADTVFPNVS